MNQELAFNFHDKIGLQIESSDPAALAFFLSEYGHHRGGITAGLPLVRLHWEREPRPRKGQAGFRFHSHKILARWRYRIRFQDQSVVIDAAGNRMAVPMVHHMLVHPSLRYLASMQDILLLHGAAVTHQGRSLIFTGHGGAGKTTTSALMLLHGGVSWSPHADDYVFLAPESQSFAYMTRSHLYRDLLRWAPQIRHVLRPGERLAVEILGRVRTWSGQRIKWPVRVGADRLWPEREVADQATLAGLLLLRRSDVPAPCVVEAHVGEEEIQGLLEMNFQEARHFIDLVQSEAGDAVPSTWLQDWRRREHALLKSRLAAAPVFWLEIPLHAGDPIEMGAAMMKHLPPLLDVDQGG